MQGNLFYFFIYIRFVDRANKHGIPVAIINNGETRAERNKLCSIVFKSETACSKILVDALKCFS